MLWPGLLPNPIMNLQGFDKAPLSPAVFNKASARANRESFLMSNISPQLPGFNRGIWSELESWISDLSEIHSIIFAVAGPIFSNNLGKIRNAEITIPGYFYTALLRFDNIFDKATAKTIGFLLPHAGATGILKDYAVSINTLETLTGINFFPKLIESTVGLEISFEDHIESQYEVEEWDFHRLIRK